MTQILPKKFPTRLVPTFVIGIFLLLFAASQAMAAPKVILISLDGATPRLVQKYLDEGVLSNDRGLGLLMTHGFFGVRNQTITPSLTAPAHIAIATGSSGAHNDINANTFHAVASPFTFAISGFGAPIGGYQISGPAPSPSPTAQPLWIALRANGKKVVTATFPGGDGVDVKIPGTAPVVQPASVRTVDYTIPFGEFGGIGAVGFTLTAADFGPAPAVTVAQLTAAGKTSFSPVLQKTTTLETVTVGGVIYALQVAALDTTNDSTTNYDTLVFFDSTNGIQPGPFSLPSTGPAYVKASDKKSSLFYFEGNSRKAGAAFYVSNLAPDLSLVRFARYSANNIPRNAPVLSNVDDINTHVGFWVPQADFRIPEKLSPGFNSFPDAELEAMYEDQVKSFVDYQTRVALRAMEQNPDADLMMTYIEQPDGSGHQFFLVDPRQPTDPLNPNSIGGGQDAAKVDRYAQYLATAYKVADDAVQKIIETVGTDAEGRPNSDIIVVSDHGFDPFHTAVNMNALLAANSIPNTKVRAVTSGPAVNLYIGLQGREPNGTVLPAEYVTLQQQVVNILQNYLDTNPNYGSGNVNVFDKVYARPLPANLADPSFGRGTSEFVGQDTGDVFALLRTGYNFDGIQGTGIVRQGDAPAPTPVLSLPNFYGAHGYDPTLEHMSAILFAAGPHIGQGKFENVRNIDVAPTIESLLGVAPAATVEGTALPIGPLALTAAVSRKQHGGAGTFDLPLSITGDTSVEPRKKGEDAASAPHTLIFTFNKELASGQAQISVGKASLTTPAQLSGNQVTVTLTASDQQKVTVSLDVTDIYGGTLSVPVSVGFLRGDVNRNGQVTTGDVNLVQGAAGAVNAGNFTDDVNLDGTVNHADAAQTSSRVGNTLP